MIKILNYGLAAFFIVAGAYHFIDPDFYYGLIPDYFPFPIFLNYLSGFCEIVLGILVTITATRKMGAYGIIALLLVFIPSHVYFIQIGSCATYGLCVPEWVSWSRLLIVHPILIYWAWYVSKIP